MDEAPATLDYLWQIPLAIGSLRIAWLALTAPFVIDLSKPPQEKKR
jgi:hypothetical protein